MPRPEDLFSLEENCLLKCNTTSVTSVTLTSKLSWTRSHSPLPPLLLMQDCTGIPNFC